MKNIYVVDDSDAILTQVGELLKPRYNVRTFRSAANLLSLAEMVKDPPAMILLDVEMPNIEGSEAMNLIRLVPNWETVPILLLTAWESDVLLEHFLTEGALDVIHKPIIPSVFYSRIANYLKLAEFLNL